MKNCALALSASLLLTSCASVKVHDTQVASGAANPRAIYIRPFDVTATHYAGHHRGDGGERPIRQSLAGRAFANDLKNEMEKLAPAMVIENDEFPAEGWIVEGSLDEVHGGSRFLRGLPALNHLGTGASEVLIHVRISQVGGHSVSVDKDASKLGQKGRVLYEFDLKGGSRLTGELGAVAAPGFGDAETFDFKNAAERVMMALSTDPHGYGDRSSPVIR